MPVMRNPGAILLALIWYAGAFAQEPPRPDLFHAGVWGDDARTVTCVSGQAGGAFEQVVWAWVPDDLGLSYITLRFDLPLNLDLSARAVYNDLVVDVIISDYSDGTVEWNMLFSGCPSGWVRVFSQECVLLDGEPSLIGIHGVHSMMRDCTFVLNDLVVLNELVVNDPDCATVPAFATPWGSVKILYR